MWGKLNKVTSIEEKQDGCTHPAKSCLPTNYGIICGLCGKELGNK